jgi:secondary thiamine-phosphate synthase enzyme
MHKIQVKTSTREAMLDVTSQLMDAVRLSGVQSGVVLVFTPHTTTGLTINEGADPDVCRDILAHLRRMVPRDAGFLHAEGNSDAHIKASIFGSSVQIIIDNGQLQLGTWQRVFLGEFDGPRTRTLWITFLS